MNKVDFKILIIRHKKIVLWIIGVLFLVLIYSFFSPNEYSFDIWKVIADTAHRISNSYYLSPKWNHMIMTIIFILFPIFILSIISVFRLNGHFLG